MDPVYNEVAPRLDSERYLSPWIGELDPDPRRPRSRYALTWDEEYWTLQIYRSVLRDDRAAAALEQRIGAAIARPWEVLPGGDRRRDKAAASYLEDVLRSIPFVARCRQLLHYCWYGYSVAEILWRADGARVGVADIKVRSPERFTWSRSGELLLRTAERPTGERVPPAKFLVLKRDAEHGDVAHAPGLAWWCYWPVFAKRLGEKFWSVALERFGSPVPIGHYPSGDKTAANELIERLESYVRNRAMVLPEGTSVELLDSARRTGGDYDVFVKHLNQAITTLILGQSSTTDQGPWKGTAEVQKDIRDETVAADTRVLDEALIEGLALPLTQWNFPGAAVPRIHHDTEPPEDLDRRATREEQIARTSGLRPTLQHVMDVYGGEWEPAPAGPELMPGRLPAAALAAPGDSRAPALIEAVAVELTTDWRPLVGKLPDGDTPEAFRRQTADLMAEPPPEALRSRLNNASFSAAASAQAEEP